MERFASTRAYQELALGTSSSCSRFTYSPRLLLLVLLVSHHINTVQCAADTVISSQGGYPRLAMVTFNGVQLRSLHFHEATKIERRVTTALAAAEHRTQDNTANLMIYERSSTNFPETWTEKGPAVSIPNATPDVDLANSYLFQLPNGTLLIAYRHHDGNGTSRVYRIQLSSSQDGGATWGFVSTITEGPIGVWEPFLYSIPGVDDTNTVRVAYSGEITNGGEQDIVFQVSIDGGTTWGPISSRIHTPVSRNGMPGVVSLLDGSLLCVFEGFWSGTWGHFTVNSARSFDNGTTWPQREIVHAPANNGFGPNGSVFCSGSPQVGVCPATGKIVVIYMSNELVNMTLQKEEEEEEEKQQQLPWPEGAHVGSVAAHLDYSVNVSLPLNWTVAPPADIPTTAASIFWPSLFLDNQDPLLGALHGEAGEYSMRVAYQAENGSAMLTISSLCID